MAAPTQIVREFENWLNERLDSLEVDREVYGAYILGVLQEEENGEEQKDALQGILSAFLEEDTLEEVCQQILKQWTECSRSAVKGTQGDAEVQAIASLIEKQAQIVVKQKEVSEEAKKRKEALLAQYAHVTDEEDEDDEEEPAAVGIPSEKSPALFKNTNVEDVLDHRKQQRDQAREDAEKKKEQDKMQREKDKLAKQERKDKEKKRTQKGERKR
ncbi:coiled-coil domain-containing protein 43-like isoform X1 [Sinocyclocheilus anshuiensis]|uniref:coiled-coil domain-containing protein 43-like isoform X1 n=1 Tax=Sinocyclocheilus anshuiensis TaxID=1608454 RepID=UPI0007BA41E6|nr:PREDICTED: coiled-coil domain-containing protein 43-like isoform X1 [Sinocyclocheilus anshuiensis]